jgi:hypothetical protein
MSLDEATQAFPSGTKRSVAVPLDDLSSFGISQAAFLPLVANYRKTSQCNVKVLVSPAAARFTKEMHSYLIFLAMN